MSGPIQIDENEIQQDKQSSFSYHEEGEEDMSNMEDDEPMQIDDQDPNCNKITFQFDEPVEDLLNDSD